MTDPRMVNCPGCGRPLYPGEVCHKAEDVKGMLPATLETRKAAHYMRAALIQVFEQLSAAEVFRESERSDLFDACLREADNEIVRAMDLMNVLRKQMTLPVSLMRYRNRDY